MAEPRIKLPQFTPQDIARFWSKVDKTPGQGPQGECWIWTATRREGYGRFKWRKHLLVATRVSYFLATNDDPCELNTLHSCDNPPCVNPSHLSKGTDYENTHEMIRKGRARHPSGDANPARMFPERLARGDHNGNSTLTTQIVHEIRKKYSSGGYTQRKLAEEYHCSQHTICTLVRRITWRHI